MVYELIHQPYLISLTLGHEKSLQVLELSCYRRTKRKLHQTFNTSIFLSKFRNVEKIIHDPGWAPKKNSTFLIVVAVCEQRSVDALLLI